MPVSIEIFGVKGYVYDVLKTLLQEALGKAGLEYVIQDVQKIEEFIAEGLDGVPTVRIDHKKSFTKTDDISSQTIVKAVIEYILANNVQYAICPIDFSDHSIHAASWALQLSKALRMSLKLLHVYKPIAEFSYSLPTTTDVPVLLDRLNDEIKAVSKKISSGISPSPVTHVEVGDPLQVIVHISKEPSSGMIVMGTQGAGSLARRFFGTISSAVARHANVPVLLIPPLAAYKKPQQIMIAFHEELLSHGVLSKLLKFNHHLKAHLHFVHVREIDGDFHEIRDNLMDKLTNNSLPDFSFDVQEIESGIRPILQALLIYAEVIQPHMIVFVTKHRNVIRRLLQPRSTQQTETGMKWPLLIMRNG